MAGIIPKIKKSSAVLKHYACTGVYLACTCSCTEVLLKVLVSPSHRKSYVIVLVLQSTCTLLEYFAKYLAPPCNFVMFNFGCNVYIHVHLYVYIMKYLKFFNPVLQFTIVLPYYTM